MRVSQRGRAILRRMSAHDSRDTEATGDTVQAFRPGDFLLTSSSGGLARLLGYATASKINHAAVIIDPEGTVIEANPLFLTNGQAFRVSSVQQYLKAGKPCWIGYVEVREGSRQEVAGYVEHLVRASGVGSISGRFWLALHTILSIAPRSYVRHLSASSALRYFFEHRSVIMRENLCYSSGELVARALERGGFIWEHDPAQITPADIFRRYRQPEFAPVASPPKPAYVAHESLVGVRGKSAKSSAGGVKSSARRSPQRETELRTSTSDLVSTGADWRAFIGIGVATFVGLACVGFLEQLTRSIGRKA